MTNDLEYPTGATRLPDPVPLTFTQRRPVVVKVTAGIAFVSALLLAVSEWVHFTDGQMSALSAVVTTGGALLLALWTERSTTPWAPIEADELPDVTAADLNSLLAAPRPWVDSDTAPADGDGPSADVWAETVDLAEVEDPGK